MEITDSATMKAVMKSMEATLSSQYVAEVAAKAIAAATWRQPLCKVGKVIKTILVATVFMEAKEVPSGCGSIGR